MEINNKKKETNNSRVSKEFNRGAWTAEEDRKLAEVIAVHGPKRWKAVAAKPGLNRCGKSCRLRWLNYLRPNIKRGNVSDQEEDLILRLHKLLGNRWSLIAGRLPGRTDNEIKNYWNSHLSKKLKPKQKLSPMARKGGSGVLARAPQFAESNWEATKLKDRSTTPATTTSEGEEDSSAKLSNPLLNSNANDDFFDFSNESSLNLEWVTMFLEFDRRDHQS